MTTTTDPDLREALQGMRQPQPGIVYISDVLAYIEPEMERRKRGGKELGKIVVFLTELIKDVYVRAADDPTGALLTLGDYLSNLFEDEGGLSTDDHNRVYRALEARRSEEEARQREENARRRAEVSQSLADIAHAQRPLTDHERAFRDGA